MRAAHGDQSRPGDPAYDGRMTATATALGATLVAGTTWWWVWTVAGVVAVALLAVLGLEVTHRDGRGFDS